MEEWDDWKGRGRNRKDGSDGGGGGEWEGAVRHNLIASAVLHSFGFCVCVKLQFVRCCSAFAVLLLCL